MKYIRRILYGLIIALGAEIIMIKGTAHGATLMDNIDNMGGWDIFGLLVMIAGALALSKDLMKDL